MNCRKNVSRLTDDERKAYAQAVIDLKTKRPSKIADAQAAGATSRYDDYVWIHMVVGGGAHQGPAFAPWHREFLKQLERDLQEVSGDPHLTIPYWDWTTARTSSHGGWPFTDNLMGGFGTGADNRVETGRFAEAGSEWVLNVRTGAAGGPARDDTTYLRREDGTPGFDPPTQQDAWNCLDITTYDAAPWIRGPGDPFPSDAQILASFRKFLEYVLHNNPHGWVGGNMMPMTSPNDPTFFLHHCNIDRLWAVWQQKHGPAVTTYQPPNGTTAQHDIEDTMARLLPGYFNHPVADRPIDVIDHRALGFWYDSDLPIITLDTPSLDFGEVPEGLTTYRPARFSVRTCRQVKFRITGIGGAGFSIPPEQGPVVAVDHDPDHDPVDGQVFVAFEASPGLAGAQTGSVALEAFIEDAEGYYAAAPGGEYVVGTWPLVNLTATPAPRERNAVALVLDRSGSMSIGAGGAGTRADLLKTAVDVVADLMDDGDGIGIVTYDDVVERPLEVTEMGAASPPGAGRQAVDAVLAGTGLDPRGLTAIGAGIIEGADLLADGQAGAATPYQNLAMVVMTDGNENVAPMVASPAVQGVLTNRTFAIGLGRAGEVSAPVLSDVAGGTGGYMLVTGDMTGAAQRFKLTKYFVQVLAGIANAAVLVDPDGDLPLGVRHRVPFEVAAGDVRVDAIVLSPLAPILRMVLEAPDGTLVDADAGLPPNAEHRVNPNDAFYRVLLPADPARPGGTHAGTWHALLEIDRAKIRQLGGLERTHLAVAGPLAELRRGSLPYSLLVHAHTNIRLAAEVAPQHDLPGRDLDLVARLTQYGIPFAGSAAVEADVTDPLGGATRVALADRGGGRFAGAAPAPAQGLYQCRFVAAGYGARGGRFRREETRTATRLTQRPGTGTGDGGGAGGEGVRWMCEALMCMLGDEGLARLLEERGIDRERLMRCLKEACARARAREREAPVRPAAAPVRPQAQEPAVREALARQLVRLLDRPEQLGLRGAQDMRPIDTGPPETDPHEHMDFFPLFLREKGKIRHVPRPGEEGHHEGGAPKGRKGGRGRAKGGKDDDHGHDG